MKLTSQEMLRRLGNGDAIAKVCETAGIARGDFDAWWRAECKRRVPSALGVRKAGVERDVRIERDRWGIPHVHAESDRQRRGCSDFCAGSGSGPGHALDSGR